MFGDSSPSRPCFATILLRGNKPANYIVDLRVCWRLGCYPLPIGMGLIGMARDVTERFGDRVGAYAKARPSYPAAVLSFLAAEFGLAAGQAAADLGSGTGIFSGLLLERGLNVFAVEPNAEMRAKAEATLGGRPGFTSVAARAEATTLAPGSVDWVFAAQAFHWFNAETVRDEVRRILKPGGYCALIWNERQSDTSAFARAYEDFLVEWGVDYVAVKESYENPKHIACVLGNGHKRRGFPHAQEMDLDMLRTRNQSASYVPKADTARGQEMMAALDRLFEKHQQNGIVRFDYSTNVYCARIV